MNLAEFVKNYLSLIGVPTDKLDENASKVLYTAIISVMKEQSVDDNQAKKLEEAVSLLREDKKQESIEAIKTVFSGADTEAWQAMFVEKLIESLLDMTDKIGGSLTEETKQKLAGLIDGLSA